MATLAGIGEHIMQATSLNIIRDEHASLAAMLGVMVDMVHQGPGESRRTFFDVLRAMLFYIDEYPERLHHPKESRLLFPMVLKHSKAVMGAIDKLERDHQYSERAARELQHLLLSWELLGTTRKAAFVEAFEQYVRFYREHMALEEDVILPEALKVLSPEDWAELDRVFAENEDPLTGKFPPKAEYEGLFSTIVARLPAQWT